MFVVERRCIVIVSMLSSICMQVASTTVNELIELPEGCRRVIRAQQGIMLDRKQISAATRPSLQIVWQGNTFFWTNFGRFIGSILACVLDQILAMLRARDDLGHCSRQLMLAEI